MLAYEAYHSVKLFELISFTAAYARRKDPRPREQDLYLRLNVERLFQ